MKSELKKLPNSVVELTIEEEAKAVAKYRAAAIKALKKDANIKGFRKGADIPEAIIVKNFGEDQIAQMTVENAIDDLYQKALRENSLMPVAQANIKEIASQSPLKVIIEVEVYPEISIDDKYKEIKIKKTIVKVTKKEIEATIEDIQTRLTGFEATTDAEYKIKTGDRVHIDTDGFDKDGKLLESTSMKNYGLVIGSNMLVPGFEDGVIGAVNGQELELDITFPADYHNADFAGKDTKFKVKINSIEESKKPEITPEFIKALRGKEMTLEEFSEQIKSELRDTKESNARLKNEEDLIEQLLKISTLELGESLIKGSINKVFAEIKENITQSGAKATDYIASLGMSEEEYLEKNVRPVAIKRLQGELLLHKLYELESVELDDKEMAKEIKGIIAKYENEEVKTRLADLYVPGTKYYEELKTRMGYKKLVDQFIG